MSEFSIPLGVPTNAISASGIFILIMSAIASAGLMCPPVPPPLNNTLILLSLQSYFFILENLDIERMIPISNICNI